MIESIRHAYKSISRLLYPELCMSCSEEPSVHGDHFCVFCQVNLPFTDHFEIADNTFMRHFYGRIRLESGASLFYFTKGSRVQDMLHKLKYRGRHEVGRNLGKMAAEKWISSVHCPMPDVIIPVPVTHEKKKKRGYNQAQMMAEGIAAEMKLFITEDCLIKTSETDSQTLKSRSERLKNVQAAFTLNEENTLAGQHILLVDDVITTGATIEACVHKMEKIPRVKISVLTIAIASD